MLRKPSGARLGAWNEEARDKRIAARVKTSKRMFFTCYFEACKIIVAKSELRISFGEDEFDVVDNPREASSWHPWAKVVE